MCSDGTRGDACTFVHLDTNDPAQLKRWNAARAEDWQRPGIDQRAAPKRPAAEPPAGGKGKKGKGGKGKKGKGN